MSNENVKEIAENRSELTLKIEKNDFDAAVNRAYKKNVRKISVPGFRAGKAPKSIIEKMYGTSVFYDDALDELLPDIYSKAVEESGLDVVSRPELEIVSIDDSGVIISAKVYTRPVAVVENYKGLEAEKEEASVTDEEIDNEIMGIRKRNSRMLTIDNRAVENGDIAVIDFEGFKDGVPFEGGKGEKYNLTIGSGSFIPGFEEQIIGHNTGDNFDITVTFPEEYGEKSLAGKKVIFKIVLHEIKKEEIPELDDDFVKDVSENLNTVDEYKSDIKAKITERKEKANDRAFEEKVIDALLANTKVTVPDCMIDDEVENDIRDYDYRLRSQGGSLEMYFKYTGQDEAALKNQLRPGAERRVRTRLALDAVKKAENITATPDEIEEEYKKIASGYTMELDAVKERIPEEGIADDVAMRKTVDFIKSNAVVINKKAAEDNVGTEA